MQSFLVNLGAMISFLWGLGHLVPTRGVVNGFGEISVDNRRIITMEWVLEGVTLVFLGTLAALVVRVVGVENAATVLVVRACAAMLYLMAGVSAATGAKTSVLPMKLCPLVKVVAASLMMAGTLS